MVRMVLHGQLPVSFLDFFLGCGFVHAECFVIVFLGHICITVFILWSIVSLSDFMEYLIHYNNSNPGDVKPGQALNLPKKL
jgi:hypothetical protein